MRERICGKTGKNSYRSLKELRNKLSKLQKHKRFNPPKNISYYECEDCDGWHWGHRNKHLRRNCTTKGDTTLSTTLKEKPATQIGDQNLVYKGVNLIAFAIESFAIEGIDLTPPEARKHAVYLILFLDEPLTLQSVINYQKTVVDDKPLRNKQGMNVKVGKHVPPAGGEFVQRMLETQIQSINENKDAADPHFKHKRFENLHPFMDGNGRTGRAIWLWQMTNQNWGKVYGNSFLRTWYYNSLEQADG